MTGRRVAGIILLAVGALTAICSGGFVAAYYSTTGFYDGPEWLADLGSGSIAAGGVGVGLGAVIAVAGGVLLVAKRETPAA